MAEENPFLQFVQPQQGQSDNPFQQFAAPQQAQTPAQPPQRGVMDKVLGLTGPSKLWPVRAVKEIADIPRQFMQAAEAGPPGSRAVTEAAIKPAAEAAMTFTPASPALLSARVAAPATADLLKAARAPYKGVSFLDLQVAKPHVDDFVTNTVRDLQSTKQLGDTAFSPITSPKTFQLIDQIGKLDKDHASVADIEGLRSQLRTLSRDPMAGPDAVAAGRAVGMLDDWFSNLTADQIKKGSAEDVDTINNLLKSARSNWRAAMRSERVTDATTEPGRLAEFKSAEAMGERRAARTGLGANTINAMRQEIGKLGNDPSFIQGSTPEQRDLVKEIEKGTVPQNLMRALGKFGPKHPILGWPAAFATDLMGGHGLATAQLALGAGAEKMGELSTKNLIRQLDESIRRESALAKSRPEIIGRPVGPAANAAQRATLLNILSQIQAQQQGPSP